MLEQDGVIKAWVGGEISLRSAELKKGSFGSLILIYVSVPDSLSDWRS